MVYDCIWYADLKYRRKKGKVVWLPKYKSPKVNFSYILYGLARRGTSSVNGFVLLLRVPT